MPWFSVYLKGILVNDLEKGVRFIIKRYRPVEKTATAKSHPSWFQFLVPAIHKTSVEENSAQADYSQGTHSTDGNYNHSVQLWVKGRKLQCKEFKL